MSKLQDRVRVNEGELRVNAEPDCQANRRAVSAYLLDTNVASELWNVRTRGLTDRAVSMSAWTLPESR